MLVKDYYNRLQQELVATGRARMKCCCGEVRFRLLDSGRTLKLFSVVFSGGDYLPPAVRKALSSSPPGLRGGGLAATAQVVNESDVYIVHQRPSGPPTADLLERLAGEFCPVVAEWRRYLEDEGNKDLIPVSWR